MAGGRRPFAVAIAAAALGLGALWLRSGGGRPEPRSTLEGAGHGAVGARETAGDGVTAPVSAGPAPVAPPPDPAAPSPARRLAVQTAAPVRPEDGPEAEAWRSAAVAFRPRELGRMGASVKVALDAARRDMQFCFRDAARARGGAPGPPDAAAAPPPEPAILLLYLEARQGALDVVDAQVDYLGGATPELVECCREVLRGFEIPAFDAIPGRRYRLKFPLE